MQKKTSFIVGILLVFAMGPILTVSADPPPDTSWARIIGDEQHLEECYCVRQTVEGGYILVGRRSLSTGGAYSDLYLVKTNSTGYVLWERSMDIGINGHVRGNAVEQTPDGGYIIAGWADTTANEEDGLLVKTTSDGSVQWMRLFGGGDTDMFKSVTLSIDGGYVAAGWTDSFGDGSAMAYLVKVNAAGNAVWQYYYGGSGNDYANSVAPTADGGYIFVGSTTSEFSPPIDDEAIYLVKIQGNGQISWYQTFDYSEYGEEVGASVQQTTDGGYIIGGWLEDEGDPSDTLFIKTNAQGVQQWVIAYDWGTVEVISSIQQTADGGYIAAGRTNSIGYGNYDVLIIRLNGTGDYLWGYTFGGTDYDAAYSVRQTADGGYIIAGKENNLGGQRGTGIYLIKLGHPLPFSMDLELNKTMFYAGDPFRLDMRLANHSGSSRQTDVYVALEVYGTFFFWPSWRQEPVDYETRTLPDGYDQTERLLDFTWPSGTGSASGLHFWGVLLDTNTYQLLTDVEMVEFGYNS